jgi:hypothetical protein
VIGADGNLVEQVGGDDPPFLSDAFLPGLLDPLRRRAIGP